MVNKTAIGGSAGSRRIPGVNCQEKTAKICVDDIGRDAQGEAMLNALEFDRRDAIAAAGSDYKELPIALGNVAS